MKSAASQQGPTPQQLANSLRQAIRWPAAHRFLGGDGISRWADLAAQLEAQPASQPQPPDLVWELSNREDHWHWLAVAVLAGEGGRALKGGGAQLGKQNLRRLAITPGGKLVNAGKAVAHINRQLCAGVAVGHVDFSDIPGLTPWQGNALRYALALLAGPIETVQAFAAASAIGGGGKPLPTLAFEIPLFKTWSGGPDLPSEDLYYQPPNVTIPDTGELGSEQRRFQGSPIYERWLAEGCHTVHLSGALLPGTERTFTRGEALRLGEALAAYLGDADLPESLRLCALAFAISLLTGCSRKSVVGAMARLVLHTQDRAKNWLSPTGFKVTIPHHQAFGKPAAKAVASLLPTATEFWLPLPGPIQAELERLGQFQPDIWKASEHGWNAHFVALKQHLAVAVPRFSEVRVRHVLPVATWLQTGDIVRAQMVSGQLLDHPSAALHYYAFSVRELVDTYVASIRSWVPDAWTISLPNLTEADGALIGAPNAAIRDDALRHAVSMLCQRAHSKSKDVGNLIDAYNRLVSVTVAMFAAATAHRLTYHLGLIRIGDFILDMPDQPSLPGVPNATASFALVVFADKLTDNGLVFRVAAVPPILKEQILALLAGIRILRKALVSIPAGQRAAETLETIEKGRSPLFQRIERPRGKPNPNMPHLNGYHLRRFRRADLRAAWSELEIPVEHLRHRFTTIARRHGFTPDDTRRQMGHSVEVAPFGAADPDSVLDFVRRVAAPLDAALRADGWNTTRIDAHDAAAIAMPPVSCSAVVGLERTLNVHAAHRWGRFRRVVEAQGDYHRAEIVAVIEQLIQRPATAGEESEVQGIRTEVEADSISDRLARCCSQPEMQPEISKVLRSWVRSQKAEALGKGVVGLWSAPLPAMTFRKRVENPLITPAVTRAYATASGLLAWAESQEMGADLSDHQSNPTMLALAVLELSIRGGLTSPDRLLRCVRGLGSVRQLGDRADHVVLTIDPELQLSGGRAESRATSGSADEVPEGLLLTGIPALLALVWRSQGIDASGVTLSDLSEACADLVPKALLGTIESSTTALETILHVAGLARRLTQPGLRSAWEEGRIMSRSLDPSRVAELESLDWCQPTSQPPIDAGTPVSMPAVDAGHATADAKFLKWVRAFLHRHLPRKGRPVIYSNVADAIEQKLGGEKGCGGTSSAFVRLVAKWLRHPAGKRKRVRTIYTYLVAILEPLLAQLGSADLLQLDSDDLEELITRVVRSKREKNRDRTVRVIQELLAVVTELGGAQVEESALASLQPSLVTLAAPYLVTNREYLNARLQLQHWTDRAATDYIDVGSGQLNALDCGGALRLLSCSKHGLRSGEGLTRRHEDLVDASGELVLLVRPRRADPLKTLSSTRAVELLDLLEDEREEFQRWSAAGFEAAQGKRGTLQDRGIDSLRELGGERAIGIARTALSMIASGDAARYHAGRHTLACSSVVSIMPGSFDANSYRAIEPPRFLKQLAGLPTSIQLHAVARALGQATPLTTLTYYVHLIGYMKGCDRGWCRPTTKGFAALTFKSHAAIRTKLSRESLGAADIGACDIIHILGVGAPPVSKRTPAVAFVPTASPPLGARAATSSSSHQSIGELLLGFAAGRSRQVLMAEHGIDESRLGALLNEAMVLQAQYRYALLRVSESKSVEAARRVPRANDIGKFLKRCDEIQAESPERWDVFVSALERQTRLDGNILVSLAPGSEHVPAVMQRIVGSAIRYSKSDDGRLKFDHGVTISSGAAKGRLRSPIALTYFVVLLLQRLRSRRSAPSSSN